MPAWTQRAGIEQALLAGALEDRAVVVGTAEVRVPDVVVGVEVHEPERAVHRRRGAQLGERHRVVAADAERDRAAAVDRPRRRPGCARACPRCSRARSARRRSRRTRARRRPCTSCAGLYGPQQRRGRAHGLGPEARARPERRAGVPRDAEERDVDVLGRLDVRQPPERARAAVARRLRGRRPARTSAGTPAIGVGESTRARSALASSRITPRAPPLSATRSRASQSAHRVDGQRRARAERRDAADLVPGQPLGVALGRPARPSASRAARARPRSESSRSPGTSANAKPSSSSRDERLRDDRRVEPERLGRVRRALDAMLVAVLREGARPARAGTACRASPPCGDVPRMLWPATASRYGAVVADERSLHRGSRGALADRRPARRRRSASWLLAMPSDEYVLLPDHPHPADAVVSVGGVKPTVVERRLGHLLPRRARAPGERCPSRGCRASRTARTVLPAEAVVPPGGSQTDLDRVDHLTFADSRTVAGVVALRALGRKVDGRAHRRHVRRRRPLRRPPTRAGLRPGMVITAIDGVPRAGADGSRRRRWQGASRAPPIHAQRARRDEASSSCRRR